MLTQRDLDIAELEAKAKIDKLFEEWMISYLGDRAPKADAKAAPQAPPVPGGSYGSGN